VQVEGGVLGRQDGGAQLRRDRSERHHLAVLGADELAVGLSTLGEDLGPLGQLRELELGQRLERGRLGDPADLREERHGTDREREHAEGDDGEEAEEELNRPGHGCVRGRARR